MAKIYSMDGNTLTEGLQGCAVCDEAIDTAISIARRRGEDVELHDDDGVWLVHPDGRPADFVRAA